MPIGASRAAWLIRIALIAAMVAVALAACAPAAPARPTATMPATAAPTLTPTRMPAVTPTPSATATPPPTPAPTAPDPSAGQGQVAPVPVLMYHHITDLPDDASASRREYAASPARFEEQLRYLKEHGYESVSLYPIVRHLENGKPLPAKAVAITFDDGYRDNAVVALPLLQKYGFTATFFINPQPIQDEYPAYMTWAQVEHISRSGMDVESHSYSHPTLTSLSEKELLDEVRKAADAIEKHAGRRPRLFSYPYGRYNRQVIDLLQGEGYIGAVTLRSGTVQASPSVFEMARVWVRYDDTLESFAAKLARGW